jgi:hypothetical protein
MKKIPCLAACLTLAVATLCHAETLPKAGVKGPLYRPQQVAPPQDAPQQAAPQQVAPQQDAPQQVAPQQVVPQQAVPQQTGQAAKALADKPVPKIVRVASSRDWLKEGGISLGLTGINDATFQEYSLGDHGVLNITFTNQEAAVGGHYCEFVPRPGSRWALGDPQPDGTRSLYQTGYLKPFRNASRDGNIPQALVSSGCTLKVGINFKRTNGEQIHVSDVVRFDVRPHQEVKIKDTSKMRNWLRPAQSLGCTSDDSGGQLGVKITTGPLGATCRTDFMTTRNRNRITDWNSNMLPEGTYLSSLKWRLAGDTGTCRLCPDPRRACREPVQQLQTALAGYQQDLVGPIVKDGSMSDHLRFGIVSSYPFSPVDLDANNNVLSRGIIFGTNSDRKWHEFVYTLYSQMSCAAWTPPPSNVAATIGSAARSIAGGNAPGATPPPPSLRLVLDEAIFLRPQASRLSFE